VGRLLVSDGLTLPPPPLGDLERFFRAWGRKAPFRIVRCGVTQIAVAPDRYREASVVGAAAIRMVQHRGLVGAEAQTSAVISTETARRVVRALPRICGLDGPDRRWFSLVGARSGLLTAVGKVAAVADELPLDAFERYLVEVSRCAVAGERVRLRGGARRAHTSRGDAARAPVRRRWGPRPATLRRSADTASLPVTKLGRLLRLSPLVLAFERDRVRLIGSAVTTFVS
jgi:hypothetical protein